MRRRWPYRVVAALLAASCMGLSWADVAVNATRVIYDAGQRDRSLMLANTGDKPLFVQTWVDRGESDPEAAPTPFTVLPAVVLVPAHAMRALRILHTGEPMPTDRESVYWINVYQIPASEQNRPTGLDMARVDVALNLQLKVFFRPASLQRNTAALTWSDALHARVSGPPQARLLHIHNPTPYHASFTRLTLRVGEQTYPVAQEMDMMAAPFSERTYQLGATPSDLRTAQLHIATLDDAGHTVEEVMALTREP